MAKTICLFNHKGGVSKTTTAFNLGWKMAEMGAKVLMIDFDPQCNLTGMVMGFDGIDDLEKIYTDNPPNNVRDALAPAFEAKPKQIEGATCMPVKGNPNLFLLAGHIGLSEYETTLGVAQELSGSLLPLRNLPGSIRFMIDETASKIGADYVLIDMSPSLGPLNQNLFTTSDHFLVPLHPDYFSSMALSSLARTLPRWKSWAVTAHGMDVLANADYPFPAPNVQFIGSIIQKYRPRLGKASKAFQHWIDELEEGMKTKLIPALERAGMLDSVAFEEKIAIKAYSAVMEVADFNSLIALSQDFQVPVFALTEGQTGQQGAVWAQTKASMQTFEAAFKQCAERVFALTA
jgi:cellulose biosynthesis protein BcsQ